MNPSFFLHHNDLALTPLAMWAVAPRAAYQVAIGGNIMPAVYPSVSGSLDRLPHNQIVRSLVEMEGCVSISAAPRIADALTARMRRAIPVCHKAALAS